MTWEEACKNITDNICNMLIKKQKDYGRSNILEFGEFGIVIRTNDKMSRLKNLYKNQLAPNNEAIDDSWLDIAGYAVIALMLRNNTFELEWANKK